MMLWKKLQLSVSSTEARLEAVRQLARSRDPGAVDVLIDALKDRDGQVPVAAAQALGCLGNPRAVPALVALLRIEEEYLNGAASEALVAIGHTAVASVVALLRDADPHVRERAARTLGQIGVEALAPLSAHMRSPDPQMRAAIAEALGHINHPRSVEMLLGALNDRENRVIDQAARALVRVGKTAVPGLLKLLNDSNNDLHQRALAILQKLGVEPMTETYLRPVAYGKWKDLDGVGAPTLTVLDAELKDVNRGKRYTAVLTLANFCDARAVPGLTTALVDTDREIRETATRALVKIKAGAVDHLLETLRNGPAELRAKAAVVLGYIGANRARDPLVAALKDADPGVRGAAAEALAAYQDARTIAPLLALLRDPQAQVRFSVVGTLWRISSPQVIDGLVSALRDPDSSTRKRAAQALGNIGSERVLGPLLRLFEEDREVRLEAALAVAKIHPPRGIRPLLAVAADQPLDAEEVVAILADVLNSAASKLASEDLQEVVNLPQLLEAGQGARDRSGLSVKPIETSVVVKRAADELLRRRSLPPPPTGAAAAARDRSESPRQPVKNGDVFILYSKLQSKPDPARVVELSANNLLVMSNRLFTSGSRLRLRPARAPDDMPWIPAVVRTCRTTGTGWKVECELDPNLPENVLALFN